MRPLIFACLVLFVLPLTARCQNGTGILMEPGLVLRADPPRQLTLNAHVPQFLYQPGGDSIAYVSVHDDNGARTTAVKFVGAHNKDPDTRTLYTVTGDAPGTTALSLSVPNLTLLGWSSNGRYLIFELTNLGNDQTQCFCIDIGSDTPRSIPTPIPTGTGLTLFAWSPSRTRLLIDFRSTANDSSPVTTAELYDPVQDKVQPLIIPAAHELRGWLDDNHFYLRHYADAPGSPATYFSYDLATGAETEIAKPVPPAHANVTFTVSPDVSIPKAPGLILETQPQTLKDAQGVAQTKAQTVWLRKAKAPKAVSALPIGVTPGEDDPQAQWSPEGDGVAFVAHGDLFVVGLTEQEATPYEKVAAGEKLDCAEEKQIISSNLKQIGLGILQYSLDNDEKFPGADGWHDVVFPYIKDESVFNFAGIPVSYHAPANLSLAAMDSPADTVLATADTPCAHIVLYADGHVKSFDKVEGAGP